MNGVFIVGTDTGVGKTLISALLMAGAPDTARYWKPVQTGTDSDTATVRTLARLAVERAPDVGVRLDVAASPHHAARLQGVAIQLPELLALAGDLDRPGTTWIVEGAGGLLVPYGDAVLQTDLIAALGLPVLLVASTRLGAINHTLLTARELARLHLPALGIVLSGPADPSLSSALAAHAQLPVRFALPVLADARDFEDLARHGGRLRAALPEVWP